MVPWLKTQFCAVHIGARGYTAIAKISFCRGILCNTCTRIYIRTYYIIYIHTRGDFYITSQPIIFLYLVNFKQFHVFCFF